MDKGEFEVRMLTPEEFKKEEWELQKEVFILLKIRDWETKLKELEWCKWVIFIVSNSKHQLAWCMIGKENSDNEPPYYIGLSIWAKEGFKERVNIALQQALEWINSSLNE